MENESKSEFVTELDKMTETTTKELQYLEDLMTQLRKSNDNPMLLGYYEYLRWLTMSKSYTLSSIRFALTA